ncbi:twin-arginine translocase subunit TatC [Rubeoparvulum massiliense]|uniref:twin-arginine translocase subunit TatC n=1 Tax=Rubeoparvulum massiliense TaxID=1631346 RepID=UPI0009756125|nr:twin-arginine translocase subunit TatC [Rubeoparvulum massiliense]
MEDKAMSLWDHLGELRKRIVIVLVVFFITMIIGFLIAMPVVNYMQEIAAKSVQLNVFKMTDGLRVYIQFSFIISLIITIPVFLHQVWKFVSPGLKPTERKVTLKFIPAAAFLFLLGISFGFFILFPMVVRFMKIISESMGVTEVYGLAEYFRFMFNIVLPFGLLFQMPIVVIFLTRLHIITPQLMRKYRKYSYFFLVVIGAMITPPEFISEILVTIPLLLLYEISIFFSGNTYKKMEKREEEWKKEFDMDDDESDESEDASAEVVEANATEVSNVENESDIDKDQKDK